MKYGLSSLPGAALLLLCIQTCILHAQNAADKTPDTFELSAIAIDLEKVPELYWENAHQKQDGSLEVSYEPFSIGRNRISSKYELPIVDGEVKLYSDQTPAGQQERNMVPVVTVPAEKDATLIMVIFRDKSGKPQTRYLNDDAEAHPAGTVRLANFTDMSIGVSMGAKPKVVKPKQITVLGRPTLDNNGQFPLEYVVNLPGEGPYQPPKKFYRFSTPENRLFLLYANKREFVPNEDGTLQEVSIFPLMFPILDSIQ